MLSVIAVCVAILFAAIDVFGENASIQFLTGNISGSVRLGGNVDASKLSQIVGEDTNLDLTIIRRSSSTIAKKTGMMIWNTVTTMRRFCSSQFFHSNNPNCATFDIAMVALDAALSSLSKAHTHEQ